MKLRDLTLCLGVALAALFPSLTVAQSQGPLRIEITEGVIEPLPFAVSPFLAENAAAEPYAADIARVIGQNGESGQDGENGTGLPPEPGSNGNGQLA